MTETSMSMKCYFVHYYFSHTMMCILLVQVGSADHHIHYFDMRNPNSPLFVFRGHRKAVSYVKFLSPNELASASTDSTLRLWDVQTDCSVCIFCSQILCFLVTD